MQKFFLLLLLTSIWRVALAAEVQVELRTVEDQAMPNAVIYLTAKQSLPSSAPQTIAIMDQINRQFSPHVLAVQKDTQVRFPNSDSIKHHVYSFSAAKRFELQLYKGLNANPLLFNTSGVVELGCNIHDWMLGYVIVLDTPYFAKTDGAGKVSFTLPEGEYRLNIWHPRIAQSPESLEYAVNIRESNNLSYRLDKPLLVDLNQYEAVPADVNDYE